MEQAVSYIIYAALFVALIVGGFWVIGKAGLPRIAAWVFGGIVLVIIVFALMYLARGHGTPIVDIGLMVAQTSQPSGGMLNWSISEWTIFVALIVGTLIPAIAALLKSFKNDTKISNLADATKDVATNHEGNPQPNVSPGTMGTLNDLGRGGTGNGGIDSTKPK